MYQIIESYNIDIISYLETDNPMIIILFQWIQFIIFENDLSLQVDYNRHLEQIVTQVEEILFSTIQALVLKRTPMPGSVADIGSKVVELMEEWEQFKSIGRNGEFLLHTLLTKSISIRYWNLLFQRFLTFFTYMYHLRNWKFIAYH